MLEVSAVFWEDVADDSLLVGAELGDTIEIEFGAIVSEEMTDDSMLVVVEIGDTVGI